MTYEPKLSPFLQMIMWNEIQLKMAKERRYIDESYEKEYLSSSATSPIGDLISSL